MEVYFQEHRISTPCYSCRSQRVILAISVLVVGKMIGYRLYNY